MRKNCNRILALLLACVLTFAMAGQALAADTTPQAAEAAQAAVLTQANDATSPALFSMSNSGYLKLNKPKNKAVYYKGETIPVSITIAATKENKPQITQYVIPTTREEKYGHLLYLLDADVYGRVMIFTNTKDMCHRLSERLNKAGYETEALHGDIPQSKRTQVMNGFKRGKFPILVCTDVAARGIDVDDVEAVVNYDLPNENEYYLHRIGLTGRARKHGVAFTLLCFTESVRLDEILKYMESKPTYLKFDDMGILRRDDQTAFFENV